MTPPDFKSTFASLLSPTFFPEDNDADATAAASREHLSTMVKRWQSYVASGAFALSAPMDSPLGASHIKVRAPPVTRDDPRGRGERRAVAAAWLTSARRGTGELLDVAVPVLEHGGARAGAIRAPAGKQPRHL